MGWLELCQDYSIPYRMGSKNENIEIHCPLCGDRSMGLHLGLHLSSSSWACWEDEDHRGKSPARLITFLLGVDWAAAKTIGSQYLGWNYGSFEKTERIDVVPAEALDSFFEFGTDAQSEAQFINYIIGRGIDPIYAIQRYDLRWCLSGYFSYRLILPVTYKKQWWTWIARTVAAHPIRYLAAGTEFTANKPNDFLFDSDNLKGGKLLLVVEGAWDAIKINSALIPGVSATSLFGKVIQPKQMKQLIEVSSTYEQVGIALDKDAYRDSLVMKDKLSWYLPKVGLVSPSGKDWGEMPQSQIKKEVLSYAS